MKRLAVEQSHITLREALRLAKRGPVVLTEKGRPVTALVRVGDDFALEALALSRNKALMAYLDGCAARLWERSGSSIEEVRRAFGVSRRARTTGRRPRASDAKGGR